MLLESRGESMLLLLVLVGGLSAHTYSTRLRRSELSSVSFIKAGRASASVTPALHSPSAGAPEGICSTLEALWPLREHRWLTPCDTFEAN